MTDIEYFISLVGAPPARYRSAPFWAWNESLEEGELVRQVGEMAEQKMGAFFMHSREGLETAYLSSRWMDCVEAAADAGAARGLEAWIYDEDKWPSGSAGGMVSAANPREFTAKGLTAQLIGPSTADCRGLVLEGFAEEEDLLGIYELVWEEGYPEKKRLAAFTRIDGSSATGSDCALLVCRMETSSGSEWYNNRAPTDILCRRAVEEFIVSTHEEYKKRVGDRFGREIKGFFTDEPNFCDFFSRFTSGRPWLPWSLDLSAFFREKRGYDISEILPYLFILGTGAEKARYDYWLTLTELFSSSYMKQLYDWCGKNKLELTGHVLYENDLGYSARVSGASMPHYRYMHAPGIDILGDQRREYLTVKQCTSMANQFGRRTVFSETYGCTGWDFDFAGQKRLGDWQFVMGVNRRCQHLALYSLTGCRKRDYPPSFNYHNGWWKHDHIIEDYFARLSVAVTEGSVERDLLVIHPMGSIWMKTGSSIDEDLTRVEMNMGWLDEHIVALNREGDYYSCLAETLLKNQFDFDFGDELVMKDEARLERGRLFVGDRAYKAVIVPPVRTLMGGTIELIEGFLDDGNVVYWMTPLDCLVDAVVSRRFGELLSHKQVVPIRNSEELLKRLAEKERRPVRVSTAEGLSASGFMAMSRRLENGRVATIVNTEAKAVEVEINFEGLGLVRSMNPLDGRWRFEDTVLSQDDEKCMLVQTRFQPEECRIYLLDHREPPATRVKKEVYRHPHATDKAILAFPPSARYSCSMENALPLDVCGFSLDGGPWSEPELVWKGQKALREALGLPPIYYNGAPQRYTWLEKANETTASARVGLRFVFDMNYIPDTPVFAAIEKSENFRVSCNGVDARLVAGRFLDRAIRKHQLANLRLGRNILHIDLDYSAGTELEDVYIVGDFGVSPERVIERKPDILRRGDWTLQGFFHYPGCVTYHFDTPPAQADAFNEGNDLYFKIGAFSGILALVSINGHQPIPAVRGDDRIAVSGDWLFTDKPNRVDVEIVGSLRNLLGPFHRSFTACSRISWADFRTEGMLFTPEYRVEPLGLFGESAVCIG